jgi:uncharacterized protein (DUF1015 family)
MYLDNEFYRLQLREIVKTQQCTTKFRYLNIVYTCFTSYFNMGDLRNDERIEYLSGKQSILELKNK